jgi:2-amino-4-hydroxy-6-hydroxymethyldihydropteridine diphosphokinase
MVNRVYLLLGSNLGNRHQLLDAAQKHISEHVGNITQTSGFYETAAWGKTDQPAFINQVVEVDTDISPKELLHIIQDIENQMGRIRYEKWGERIIDIDILYYNDLAMEEENIKIPHPEIGNRKFTLAPLVEIAADYLHPILRKTNRELLAACTDPLAVTKL